MIQPEPLPDIPDIFPDSDKDLLTSHKTGERFYRKYSLFYDAY